MTSTKIRWHTVSVTALPPGAVSVSFREDGELDTWPAVALLHQMSHCGDNGGEVERITLGVLNTSRGEVEAVDVDADEPFPVHRVYVDGW